MQVDHHLLTSTVVSESRVTWPTPVPILVFLGLSVLDLGPMYATDRQTDHCWEKRVQQLKKNVKSHVFWDFEKRTYSFTGHLITQLLILNYRKSVPVSHQHQTSCSEILTQETMQLRNVCDKRLEVPITSGNSGQNFSTRMFSDG